MDLEFQNFYIRDNKGTIRQWSIGVDDGTIVIEHGQLGGVMQTVTEEIYEGKAGRSLEEQIMLRVNSRISKRKDMGYVDDLKDVNEKPTNLLGLVKPMLAQKIQGVKNIDFEHAYVQRKYDGNRCMIANISGRKIAYTRNGKQYKVLNHILDSINMPNGTILDGELYCHGETLQTIVSWCKRDTPHKNTHKLKYHCYDIVKNLPFSDRFDMMLDIDYGENAQIVETFKIKKLQWAMNHFKNFRDEGYEGAILRHGLAGYEDGKRSKSLLKIKEWYDDEFKVIAINPSKDYWGVLTCMLDNGKIFGVTAPGSIDEKREVLINRHKYIGKYVTVEYSQITKDGIPFHPIAKNWIDNSK